MLESKAVRFRVEGSMVSPARFLTKNILTYCDGKNYSSTTVVIQLETLNVLSTKRSKK